MEIFACVLVGLVYIAITAVFVAIPVLLFALAIKEFKVAVFNLSEEYNRKNKE